MDSPTLLIPLLLIVIGVVFYLSYLYEQKRRKLLESWAARRKFNFQSAKDSDFRQRFPTLKILHRGHSRFARNIITGQVRDRELITCDYQYTTGHGKNRRVHNMSMIMIKSDYPLIPLFIRPEHIFDKVGEFVGLDDIDFESAEFSRTFYVKSSDKRWAYDVIHARMMEFLLAQPRFHIQMDLEHLVVYRTRRFGVDDFDAAIKLADGMYRRIPGFVVQQMTGGELKEPDSVQHAEPDEPAPETPEDTAPQKKDLITDALVDEPPLGILRAPRRTPKE